MRCGWVCIHWGSTFRSSPKLLSSSKVQSGKTSTPLIQLPKKSFGLCCASPASKPMCDRYFIPYKASQTAFDGYLKHFGVLFCRPEATPLSRTRPSSQEQIFGARRSHFERRHGDRRLHSDHHKGKVLRHHSHHRGPSAQHDCWLRSGDSYAKRKDHRKRIAVGTHPKTRYLLRNGQSHRQKRTLNHSQSQE